MPRHKVYVVKVAGKPTLKLRWQDAHGKWRQETTEETRRREAERLADQKAKQLDAGLQRPLDWYDFCERYRIERLVLLKQKSRADWETASKLYGELMKPDTVRDVTANELSKFAAAARKPYHYKRKGETHTKHFSELRISKFLCEIRRALTWAAQIRLIESVPFIALPDYKGGDVMHARPVTAEEFERMLACVKDVVEREYVESWKDTLQKYWLSGFRLEEATHIFWDRPDEHCIEKIDGKRPKLRIRGVFEKGKRDRLYPLTPDFVEYLRRTPADKRTGPVFCPLTIRGRTESETTIGRTISEIGKKARVVVDVDPITKKKKFASAHDFRRSFGTRWAPLVKPLVLQHLMRHKSISTTLKFYVDGDATSTADEVWEAYGTRLCDPLCDSQAINAL